MSSLIEVLLADPDEDLRAVAAGVLGDLTLDAGFRQEKEAILGALKSALDDPSRQVQTAVHRALRRLEA
jgi:HEAT repeat protein